MHEVFQCLKQTSILNGRKLLGKILKFSLIFILKFENLVINYFLLHVGFRLFMKGILL